MPGRNKFVFVVCGSREHTDTLNFSLKRLKHFSEVPILVVTDSARNEATIEHDQIIDIKTPEWMNHHQASIYLKTGLHKFLPKGYLYCYLDTDVVAISSKVDEIFNEYISPITFCTDHCKVPKFSQHAVRCNCLDEEKTSKLRALLDEYKFLLRTLSARPEFKKLKQLLEEWEEIKIFNKYFDDWFKTTDEILEKRKKLLSLTSFENGKVKLASNYLLKVLPNFRRALSDDIWYDYSGNVLIDRSRRFYDFMKSHGYTFNKKTYQWKTPTGLKFWESDFEKFFGSRGFSYNSEDESWYTTSGEIILPSPQKMIEKQSEFTFDTSINQWFDETGKAVFPLCDHLSEAIAKDLKVNVEDKNWQHWNGGVFLFDDNSHDFLEEWHTSTLKIFGLPFWKTRDQGTLISTVWKLGLQDQKTLPVEYNFIADFNHPTMEYKGDFTFNINHGKKGIKPCFLHIFHHWGDDDWAVWNDVIKEPATEPNPEENIFNALWIGRTLSRLELLTIHSFLAKGHKFRLWVYDKIITPLPENVILADANEIVPKEQVFSYKNTNSYGHGKGSYAGFSDIFRYKLLYERGGWWTDMDVTCLKHISTDQPYFFRPHHEMPVVGNVMKCPKGSILMKRCYDEAIERVDDKNTDWHKPVQILNNHIAQLGLQHFIVEGVCNHDQWHENSRFVWHEDPLPEAWWFIHWQNEEWRAQNVSKEEFYYKSALAGLLQQYNLYNIPENGTNQLVNRVKFHRFTRKIKKVLNIAF